MTALLSKVSKTLLLRAADADVKSDFYNYSAVAFSYPQNLSSANQNVLYRTLQLSYASIPGSFYVVNLGKNDIVSFDINGSVVTQIIPEGTYGVSDLVAFLTALFPTLTVVLNAPTQTISFESPVVFTLLSRTTAFGVLGFPSGEFTSVLVNTTFILRGVFPCDLGGIRTLIFSSRFINSLNNISGASQSYLFSIPLASASGSSSGSIIAYTPSVAAEIYLYNTNPAAIDIEVFDQEGSLVNFHGIPWLLEVIVSEYIALPSPFDVAPPLPVDNSVPTDTQDAMDSTADLDATNAEAVPPTTFDKKTEKNALAMLERETINNINSFFQQVNQIN